MEITVPAIELSSFNTIKGSLITETFTVLADWDLGQDKESNLQRLKDTNAIAASSSFWLNLLVRTFRLRFEPSERDLPLLRLAKGGCDMTVWKPLLHWHVTRHDELLRDFFAGWLYQEYRRGTFRVQAKDVQTYLQALTERKDAVVHPWAEGTIKRIAVGLLKWANDFGFLKGTTTREFASYHLPDTSFLYVLHAIAEREPNAHRIIHSPEWHVFLMDAEQVEQTVLRLHQFRQLEYHVAGTLASLKLPCATAAEYAERMVS